MPASSKAKDNLLHGTDIGKILSSKGPVVKCVLLKHLRPDGKDTKPHPASPDTKKGKHRQVLTELIEEIELDTTPSEKGVNKVLGGPFTFLGQFPTEGTVAMVRRELPGDDEEELKTLGVHKLKELCREWSVPTEGILEKEDLVQALLEAQLPINPHKLQPPLDGCVVRGDILIVKVAETKEELDEEDEDADPSKLVVPSNEEFFLDYTRDEYVAFASRTDVEAPKVEPADDEEEEEDPDDADDEDFEFGEEDVEEGDGNAMLNLLMAEILRKFREENGRGPDSEELLELRKQLAMQLGIELPDVQEGAEEEEEHSKRPSSEKDEKPSKKVKFSSPANEQITLHSDGLKDDEDEEKEDGKPKAKEDGN